MFKEKKISNIGIKLNEFKNGYSTKLEEQEKFKEEINRLCNLKIDLEKGTKDTSLSMNSIACSMLIQMFEAKPPVQNSRAFLEKKIVEARFWLNVGNISLESLLDYYIQFDSSIQNLKKEHTLYSYFESDLNRLKLEMIVKIQTLSLELMKRLNKRIPYLLTLFEKATFDDKTNYQSFVQLTSFYEMLSRIQIYYSFQNKNIKDFYLLHGGNEVELARSISLFKLQYALLKENVNAYLAYQNLENACLFPTKTKEFVKHK